MLHFKVVFSELNSKKKIVKWPKHTLKNLQSTKTFEQFALQETHKLKYVKKLQSPNFQQFFFKAILVSSGACEMCKITEVSYRAETIS